jgi:hypothetical protein
VASGISNTIPLEGKLIKPPLTYDSDMCLNYAVSCRGKLVSKFNKRHLSVRVFRSGTRASSRQCSRQFPSSGQKEGIWNHPAVYVPLYIPFLQFLYVLQGRYATKCNLNNAVFWDVTPCRCGRLIRRFGGSYRLHLQGRKIRERRTSVSRLP